MRRAFLFALVLAGVTACTESSLEPLPLEITIEPSRSTAAPGETISFVVTAQGGTLLGFDIDYGDTFVEQYGTSGARKAKVTFRHAYTERGTYQMKAKVTDGMAGEKSAGVEIRIN